MELTLVRILLFIVCIWNSCVVLGQSGKVLVRNAPNTESSVPVIQVKWYSQNLLYPEGVNVYRRLSDEPNNWSKLTRAPIYRKQIIDTEELGHDPDLQVYVDMVNDVGGISGLPDELLQMNMIIKSFESLAFADFLGLYFEDHNVRYEDSYIYKVTQIRNGTEVLLGQSEEIVVEPFEAEAMVKNFTVHQVKKIFEFDWEVEDQRFFGVNIYQTRSDSTVEELLNDRPMLISKIESDSGTLEYPVPKFKHSDLTENVAYSYQITGIDFFGEETKRTPAIEIVFNDITPPLPPTDFLIDQDTMLVHLKWQLPEDPQIESVQVFRSSRSEGPFESIYETKQGKAFSDSIQLPGPYYYYVASFDRSGNAASSKILFAEIPDQEPPAAPIGLTLVADTGLMALKWVANTEPDFMGYLVFRTVEGAKEHEVLLTGDPLNEPRYDQVFPKNVKNRFSFYVIAIDSAENRSKPSMHVVGQLPDVTGPEQPYIKQIKYSEEQIEIFWTPNVDKDLAGYHVYRSDSLLPLHFERINQNLIPNDMNRYVDRNHEPGKRYLYYLKAEDIQGNSSPASVAILTGPVRSPAVVDGKIKLVMKTKRDKQNTLSWVVSEGKWRGYMLYRGESPSELRPYTGLLSPDTRSFTDVDLTADQLIYQLRVYGTDGGILKSELQTWQRKEK